MITVAPSILSADFSRLADSIKVVEEAGADYLHLDVMDGHFVPNITIGPPVIKGLRKHSNLVFDVHLMIEQPEKYIKEFSKAGADIITVHVEACRHLHRILKSIREVGCRPAVALNPATPIDTIEWVVEELDIVLIMSVDPGFAEQSFIPGAVKKVRETREFLNLNGGNEVLIQVDGGINCENAKEILHAGADIIVAGSAIFKADDPAEIIRKIKSIKPSR